MFLFPHTEAKADKISSWAETTLQSSRIKFLPTFQKLAEKFARLTIIGSQLKVFKRWLLCSERGLILAALVSLLQGGQHSS